MNYKPRLIWALTAVVVSGVLTMSAATLGGLGSRSLGAGSTAVTPCDSNGIAISYLNVFDVATETYRTVEVGLGDVAAACDGLAFRLTLASPTGSLREVTGMMQLNGGSRLTIALSPSIESAQLTRTSLVVTG
jgi:hypothetical protein